MGKKTHLIAMDVHCQFVEGGWTDQAGNELGSFRCATSVPELLAWIEKVPRPRTLAIEEGPLADWLRGGYLKAVHHPQSLGRWLFKQRVQLYHDRVRKRVREAMRVIWFLRRFGLVVREKDFIEESCRPELLGKLPAELSLKEDLGSGCSPRKALRNTARALAAVMWGMFKSGNAYEPQLVGRSTKELQLTGCPSNR